MAEVFKAIPADARRIDQIVAIKRILPSIAEDSEFIGMFIDEARIAGQLTHPNICRMYELGRVGQDHYIAMQFLWGRDLLKVMNRHKKAGRFVHPSMAAYIGARALSALHYAHTKCDARGRPLHIIHRDVSPQNIIVGYSGQVKLIDFGVARAASQSQKTQAGILKGKFGYMSPEMVRGLPIDHRSDVFAMGICLHELLTNARLFYGETDFATLELVRDARVVPPSHKSPSVPPALDAIVMRALAREADDRFQSADEMRLALEDYLATHDPLYGQTDVGMAMRQAFQGEVQRERERLDIFWRMLDRGELVRGATVPSSPAEAAQGSQPAFTPVSGLVTDTQARESSPGEHDEPLQEEQTHIFFSADELDEITELRGGPRVPPPGPATLSDMIPPAMGDAQARPQPTFATSGTFQRAGATGSLAPSYTPPPVLRLDAKGAATLADERPQRKQRQKLRPARLVAVGVVALALGVATYGVQHYATAHTGVLAIEPVADPDALVRVDGVVRGNPPLLVKDLAPGPHEVEIEATGYQVARQTVYVDDESGLQHVKLTLERALPEPSVAGLPATTTHAAAAPQIAPPHKPRRAERHTAAESAARAAQHEREHTSRVDDPPPSTVDAPSVGSGEHTADEKIDPELAAANEGELLISTVPWSHVFIDGVDTEHDTPVRSLRVPAGAHRIGLRTPDDAMHELDIVVKPGQTLRIIRRF